MIFLFVKFIKHLIHYLKILKNLNNLKIKDFINSNGRGLLLGKVIDVLKAMGADIKLLNPRAIGGEPVADIQVTYVGLKGADIDPKLVPLAIDEFPVICIAAACAEGVTTVSGAEELRHKESDRISAMVEGLRAIGVDVEERKDGMVVTGGPITGGQIESHHDHRIAMSFAIAGGVSEAPIIINDADNVATSFPNFVDLATQAGLNVSE